MDRRAAAIDGRITEPIGVPPYLVAGGIFDKIQDTADHIEDTFRGE
jgi:hypothetical protein